MATAVTVARQLKPVSTHRLVLLWILSGNFYIASIWTNRILKVDTEGIIATIAGNGTEGYNGDGSPATEAQYIVHPVLQ